MKRLRWILIFILLLIPNSVNAVNIYNRDNLDNYGVNKKWIIDDSNINNVLSTYKVDSKEKIYDFSNVLTDEEEILLKQKIDKFIEKYDTELIILIDDLYYTYDTKNETYATDFYDYNDFGLQFDGYDGIILFRNTYASDPYYDMYTFGDAQLYFSQTRYDDILDSIYSNLKIKNHYVGFSMFIDKVEHYYEMGIPSSMDGYIVDENGFLQERYTVPWTICIIISSIITIITICLLIRRNKMVSRVKHADEYLDKNSINFRVKTDNLINSYTRSYIRSSSSSGGSSGGSRRGSSGGGHSRGGGRHG